MSKKIKKDASKKANISKKIDSSKGASTSKGANYLGLAFQMGILIFLGAYGGMKLDKKIGGEYPIFTIIFSLLAIVLSMYNIIRKEIHKNKKK